MSSAGSRHLSGSHRCHSVGGGATPFGSAGESSPMCGTGENGDWLGTAFLASIYEYTVASSNNSLSKLLCIFTVKKLRAQYVQYFNSKRLVTKIPAPSPLVV